ncbi:MAG TPA: hypothetical protein VNK70_00630 [Candidatus Paceibacterota bacterium]|nr:hypothetical protein [Candidatus Paceibacterota bacterium]
MVDFHGRAATLHAAQLDACDFAVGIIDLGHFFVLLIEVSMCLAEQNHSAPSGINNKRLASVVNGCYLFLFAKSIKREDAAEGGVGGIPPRPNKNKGQPRRLLVQNRTPQKSFVFLLEEKMVARKIKK